MANFVFETIQVGNLNDIEFSSETGEPLRKFHNWIKQQLIFESKRITGQNYWTWLLEEAEIYLNGQRLDLST